MEVIVVLGLFLVAAPSLGDSQYLCDVSSGVGNCTTVDKKCTDDREGELDRCFSNNYSVTSNALGCPAPYRVLYRGICLAGSSEVAMVKGLNVIATLSAMSPKHFSLHVRWEYHENNSRLKGFQVKIQEHHQHLCVCINDPEVREYTFTEIRYERDPRTYVVKVVSLPAMNSNVELSTSSTTFTSPTTCRDIAPASDTKHCGPPRYPTVPNIITQTSPIPEQSGKMKLHIFWDPTTVHNYPVPNQYYIRLEEEHHVQHFLATNTLNATIQALDISRKYNVVLQVYAPCSGLDLIEGNIGDNGCGPISTVPVTYLPTPSSSISIVPVTYVIPPTPTPSSSIDIDTGISATSYTSSSREGKTVSTRGTDIPALPGTDINLQTSSNSTSVSTVETNTPALPSAGESKTNSDAVAFSIPVAVVIFIVIVTLLVVTITIALRRLRPRPPKRLPIPRPLNLRQQSCPPVSITIEEFHAPSLSGGNVCSGSNYSELVPSPTLSMDSPELPPATPLFLVYSPASTKENEAVLQLLVNDLRKYVFNVIYIESSVQREILPKWVETHYFGSTAVLCVCNKEFQDEWEEKKKSNRPVIHIFKQLIYGRLNQSVDLSKIVVVLPHTNCSECIPAYLQSSQRFILNSDADTAKKIATFIRGQPTYITQ